MNSSITPSSILGSKLEPFWVQIGSFSIQYGVKMMLILPKNDWERGYHFEIEVIRDSISRKDNIIQDFCYRR